MTLEETEQEGRRLHRNEWSPCQIEREAMPREQTCPSERLLLSALTSAGADLHWMESPERECIQFELLAGRNVVANLRFSDPPSSTAIGQIASGAWVFADEGFVRPCISVRSVPGDVRLATYRSRFAGLSGHLEFFNGPKFRWRRLGLGNRGCRFENAVGESLVAVEIKCCRSWLTGSRVIGGLVCVEPHACILSELMLLVLLSWYLIVLPGYYVRFQISP